ncbi:MAG: phosphatase PAP2 family protein [Candidatus Rokubacteria bacterium]|nr:phosphatase PAP2 family protein [Candidatus Rokubacteria bacterium]
MLALPPWYETLDTACTAFFWVLLVLRFWPLVDRRSSGARVLAGQWGRPGATQALFIALGLATLFVVAEDVLEREPAELISVLDVLARDWVTSAAAHPSIRSAATAISGLTGIGLATGVLAATLCLAGTRRSRDALLFAAGTISAWALGGLLKAVFAVPRPGSLDRYGFPSGHTLVTLVAAGLLVHILARSATVRSRAVLYALAFVLAVLSGASRMVLGVHWLSDVIAGVAVGTVWLGAFTLGGPLDAGFAMLRRAAFARVRQVAVYPPSISRSLPVMNDDASLAR